MASVARDNCPVAIANLVYSRDRAWERTTRLYHLDLIFKVRWRWFSGVVYVDGELSRDGNEFGRAVENEGVDLTELRLRLRDAEDLLSAC